MVLLRVFQWEFACFLPGTYYTHSWMATHASDQGCILKGRKSAGNLTVKNVENKKKKVWSHFLCSWPKDLGKSQHLAWQKGCFLGCGGAVFCHPLDGGGWTDSWCPDVGTVSQGQGLDQTCFEVSLKKKIMHLVTLMSEEMVLTQVIIQDCNLSLLFSTGSISKLQRSVENKVKSSSSFPSLSCFWDSRKYISVQNGPLCTFPCGLSFSPRGMDGWGWNKAIGMRNRWDMQLVKEAAL